MKHLTDEQISELIDGFIVLNSEQESHLKNCSECNQKLKEWQNISQCIKKLPRETVSVELSNQIVRRLSEVGHEPQRMVPLPLFYPRYKLLIFMGVFMFLLVFSVSFVFYHIYTTNPLNNQTKSISSVLPQIASNDDRSISGPSEEILLEEEAMNNINGYYLQIEPLDEELHDITVSELIMYLIEDTDEYTFSELSL